MQTLPDWVRTGINLILILILALIAQRMVVAFFHELELRAQKTSSDSQRIGRVRTLVRLGRSLSVVVITIVALLMILDTLGINIVPLVAGAGVAGLAVSLGAQTLVKDILNGLFILFEAQYDLGDTIRIGERTGEVERLTLRVTHLRDSEGNLHIIPNGEIRSLANLTAVFSRAVVDLSLPVSVNMEKAQAILEQVGHSLDKDPQFRSILQEPVKIIPWIGLEDGSIRTRIMVKTSPGKQWGVASEIRKRSLLALHDADIQVSVPTQIVQLQN